MNRREFFGWVGVGAIASSLPVAIAACSSQTTTSTRPDGFQVVGTVAELDQKGYVQSQNGSVVVVRDSKDNNLIALNPKCTHAGCTVNWEQNQKAFVCPCHKSKFASDGKVLKGPATEPLQLYTAKLEGQNILVKGV
ncbi:MAG: ubiquinol-cytochrome c reductase iron-sulfur subunit [Scytonema sp. PMC 1069.18]|nr:ubiquinol-cytochrome c reductase iron-sulfur subunit [Scytonema sp. PMC 1069.18]MEC4882726.1 ubiquinol-cytochrome c reductase iron-sulfur subunit [Scytonema sp. PMC 1070.18]